MEAHRAYWSWPVPADFPFAGGIHIRAPEWVE